MTTTNNIYRLHRVGPRCWYVQDSRTGELVSPTFATKTEALRAVDSRNASHNAKAGA